MANYQENSPAWQLHKLRQQFDESLEVILQRNNRSTSEWKIPDWVGDLFNLLGWLVLIAFCSWLGLQIYRFLYNSWLESRGVIMGRVKPPEVVSSPPTYWWKQAQDYYEKGNYREACRALYLGLLQLLHDREILRQQLSRTDGEYLRFLGSQTLDSMQAYFTLINLHERLFFSSLVISQNHFEECQEAYDRIATQEQPHEEK